MQEGQVWGNGKTLGWMRFNSSCGSGCWVGTSRRQWERLGLSRSSEIWILKSLEQMDSGVMLSASIPVLVLLEKPLVILLSLVSPSDTRTASCPASEGTESRR